MKQDIYELRLNPDEHWIVIEALGTITDVLHTYKGESDPLIDKIRNQLLNAWAKRFDVNNETL